MLICRQTICTRTIGNKKFPDVSKPCQVTLPSYLTFELCTLRIWRLSIFSVYFQRLPSAPEALGLFLDSFNGPKEFSSSFRKYNVCRSRLCCVLVPRGICDSSVRHLGCFRDLVSAVWWPSVTISVLRLACFLRARVRGIYFWAVQRFPRSSCLLVGKVS
jgi:hypothetical protein